MILLDYIGTLTITLSAGTGSRMRLLPWQRRFLRGAFAVENGISGLRTADVATSHAGARSTPAGFVA